MQWGLIVHVWTSLWIGAFAAAILYGCYRAVEWRWPERYIGMHETFGLSSTETWLRFLAYRAIPYFLIVATTCVTVERVEGYRWLTAGVIWVSGVLMTHGRVIVETFRSKRHEVNYAGYHLQMIVLLTVVIGGATWSTAWWASVVPAPEEFLSAIWSALLVAGLGGFVIVTLRPRSQGSPWYGAPYFIDRATRDVGVETLDWLFKECIRTGADPVMLKSILVVEVVQRPRWLRRIERLGVRLGLATTSGAMQMASRTPLSDLESVTVAAEAYAGVWGIAEVSGYLEPDLGQAWPVVARHNSDMSFIKAVQQVAYSLLTSVPMQLDRAQGGSGCVIELRRYADKFALRGITRSRHLLLLDASTGVPSGGDVVKLGEQGHWRAWEIDIPPGATSVLLVEVEANFLSQVRIADGEITSVTRRTLTDVLASQKPRGGDTPDVTDSPDSPSLRRPKEGWKTRRVWVSRSPIRAKKGRAPGRA